MLAAPSSPPPNSHLTLRPAPLSAIILSVPPTRLQLNLVLLGLALAVTSFPFSVLVLALTLHFPLFFFLAMNLLGLLLFLVGVAIIKLPHRPLL